jgi:uncharacterized membrane protein
VLPFRAVDSIDPSDNAPANWRYYFGRLKMDVPVTEEQIHTLAFYLWEKEGSPDGRSQEYWEKAWQQLGSDGSLAELDSDTSSV